jgi:hypothetical protein
LARAGIGFLYYSLVVVILSYGIGTMITGRKFLEIDRNPSMSYRLTAKDGDVSEGKNDTRHTFCFDQDDTKTPGRQESCSLRQGFVFVFEPRLRLS